ncbi:MAG: OmpH family outer membrane protein [Fretibacterium sp.]|nr:OmpH family outer membrane protein [Fretibacterium sp.]
MFSKKALLLTMAALVLALAVAGAAFAATKPAPAKVGASTVGVIDIDEVTMSHPRMKDARQQMAKLAQQKENEAKTAADREKDTAKKAQIMQTKRMELVQEQQKLMEPIFKDCQQAVREVAAKKKLELVLNKAFVLVGGIDITQDVIQQLAKKK